METAEKTQKEKVIDKLREDGSVNNFWAIGHYILRLGAIICSLKKDGWKFHGEFGIGKDRKNYFYKVIKSPEPKQIKLL